MAKKYHKPSRKVSYSYYACTKFLVLKPKQTNREQLVSVCLFEALSQQHYHCSQRDPPSLS